MSLDMPALCIHAHTHHSDVTVLFCPTVLSVINIGFAWESLTVCWKRKRGKKEAEGVWRKRDGEGGKVLRTERRSSCCLFVWLICHKPQLEMKSVVFILQPITCTPCCLYSVCSSIRSSLHPFLSHFIPSRTALLRCNQHVQIILLKQIGKSNHLTILMFPHELTH